MPGGHVAISQADRIQRAGAEVLDQHIGERDEAIERRASVRLLEVEGDALLVAIDAQEIRALAIEEGRPPRACVVAADRVLDLDHAGSHVGGEHRAVRAGEHPRQIHDRETRKGRFSHNRCMPWRTVIVFAGDS